MELQIRFYCEECYLRNKDADKIPPYEFIEWSWNTLTAAVNHLKDNSDHTIKAETEINL